MRIVVIGGTGHWSYALESIKAGERDAEIAGVAPGSEGESVAHVIEAFGKAGAKPAAYADWRGMLEREKPAVAVVAPYFGDAAKVAIGCLRFGAHVFMDKPVATTFGDLDAVRAACREAHDRSGAKLAAMFGIRYEAAFLAAREAIASGAVGDVRLMHAQKSYKLGTRGDPFRDRARYGGTIPWVGAHAIDWLRWLSGAEFEWVAASHSTAANRGHGDLEATASCLFGMSGGISATVSIDYLRPQSAPTHGDDRVRVVGSEGVLEVSGGAATLIGPDGPRALPLPQGRSIFSDFLASVRGEGECMVSAEDSFAATEAALRARQSADEGRIVRWTERPGDER